MRLTVVITYVGYSSYNTPKNNRGWTKQCSLLFAMLQTTDVSCKQGNPKYNLLFVTQFTMKRMIIAGIKLIVWWQSLLSLCIHGIMLRCIHCVTGGGWCGPGASERPAANATGALNHHGERQRFHAKRFQLNCVITLYNVHYETKDNRKKRTTSLRWNL